MHFKGIWAALSALFIVLVGAGPAMADGSPDCSSCPGRGFAAVAATTVSTPSAPAGWSVANRPGGPGSRVNPAYTTRQPRSGNGSLLFDTPDAGSAVATYHAASGRLADLTTVGYDWFKVATDGPAGSAGQAVSFVLWLDADGNPATADTTAMQWEPVYNGYGAPDNTLPTGVWVRSDLTATGTNCWGDTGECHTFQEFQTTTYPNATLLAYGFSQSDNPGVQSFADLPTLQGNTTNFEVDTTTTTVSVSPQGVTQRTFNLSDAIVTIKVQVDIERTAKTTGGKTTYTYRSRQHAFVTNGAGALRSSNTLARLGAVQTADAPGRVLIDNTTPVNSNGAPGFEIVTPYIAVNAATTCSNPQPLQSRQSVNVRSTTGALSPASLLGAATTSRVCIPAALKK